MLPVTFWGPRGSRLPVCTTRFRPEHIVGDPYRKEHRRSAEESHTCQGGRSHVEGGAPPEKKRRRSGVTSPPAILRPVLGFGWFVSMCVSIELGRQQGYGPECECVWEPFAVGRLLPRSQRALEWTQVGQVDGTHSDLLPWASRASLSGLDSPQGGPSLCMSTSDQRMTWGGLKAPHRCKHWLGWEALRESEQARWLGLCPCCLGIWVGQEARSWGGSGRTLILPATRGLCGHLWGSGRPSQAHATPTPD